MGRTMKAMLLESKGSPFVLRDVPLPAVRANDVLVKLKTSAFNHRDYYIQQGTYPRTTYPAIVGSDGAGVVVETGRDVSPSLVDSEVVVYPSNTWGDDPRVQQKDFHVMGLPDQGTFAEYISVPASTIYPKPKSLSFEETATLPVAGMTAYRALFTKLNLTQSDTVLITGVGGGVAVIALQFAVAVGASVYVTSGSEEKIQRARKLGAKGGALYSSATWARDVQKMATRIDVIVDGAAGDGFAQLAEVASPGARIALYGSTQGKIHNLEPARIFWKQLSIFGTTMGTTEEFVSMLRFAEEYSIKPVIDAVFPLNEAEQAIRKMDASAQFGKIVLRNDSF